MAGKRCWALISLSLSTQGGRDSREGSWGQTLPSPLSASQQSSPHPERSRSGDRVPNPGGRCTWLVFMISSYFCLLVAFIMSCSPDHTLWISRKNTSQFLSGTLTIFFIFFSFCLPFSWVKRKTISHFPWIRSVYWMQLNCIALYLQLKQHTLVWNTFQSACNTLSNGCITF